jgi:hypothetical protein
MGISSTYTEVLMEQMLKELLLAGEAPTYTAITNRFNDFIADHDISKPLFIAEDYHVARGDSSSATDYNTANLEIQRDLNVLYRHLLKISERTITNFERWRSEAELLEGQTRALEERIKSLLLLSSDTAGFLNFVQDNFSDTSKIDTSLTTTYLDVQKGLVTLGTDSLGPTKIDMSWVTDSNVQFTVLSRSNLVSTVAAEGSRPRYVVSDLRNYWQERVYTNKPGPVSAELKINLGSQEDVSCIDVDLHLASHGSSIQLTTLYSTDDYNWLPIPVSNPTRSVLDRTLFQFTPVTMQWIKFVMTKTAPDQVHNNLYCYEFGADEISFYNEGFASGTSSYLYSKPLSVTGVNGDVIEFSKVALEVCEDIPADTSIEYYVAATTLDTVAPTQWTRIDPLDRTNTTWPVILDFGDLETTTVSGITVSYNPTGSTNYTNPAQEFVVVDSISNGIATTVSGLSSAARYSFQSSNDRILTHCVNDTIEFSSGTLELWRNVHNQISSSLVREYLNGWGFEDPYYNTTVLVTSADGVQIDFGSQPIIIDGTPVTGLTTITEGTHIVAVHKNNWKEIGTLPSNNLVGLKVADSLYPYNHRYLVNGYAYPSNWPTTESQIYRGFDIVAQYSMQLVSVFDFIHNVSPDDYKRFALDIDAEDASRLINGSTTSSILPLKVFIMKVDESNPDFMNERFVLRFKAANVLYKYLWLKIVLSTEDESKAPFLSSYRCKLSG